MKSWTHVAGAPLKYTEKDVLPKGQRFQYRCLSCGFLTTAKPLHCPVCEGGGAYMVINAIVEAPPKVKKAPPKTVLARILE